MAMLNQTSDTMWFCMWTTKWQWWKLICITFLFHIFVRYISIILNMIFHFCPFSFTCPFSVFTLINHNMFECRSRQVFLKFTGQANTGCTDSSVHNHMCVIIFFTRKLHSWHQLEEKPFVNGVDAIYQFSSMSWCTNNVVNNNRKGLWQHWNPF